MHHQIAHHNTDIPLISLFTSQISFQNILISCFSFQNCVPLFYQRDTYVYIFMCVWYMLMGSGLLKSFSADADLLFLSERCYVSESDSHAIFF